QGARGAREEARDPRSRDGGPARRRGSGRGPRRDPGDEEGREVGAPTGFYVRRARGVARRPPRPEGSLEVSMKTRAVSTLLLAFTLGAGALEAASTAVPLLYRSDPTDSAAAPRVLAARDAAAAAPGARLASAPNGRFVVSFDRAGAAPGRFVYLGFS